MPPALGFDFGTTNSALAVADGAGVRTTRAFRSVLYFDPDERDKYRRPLAVAGPEAIERYLAGDGSGRLIQSLKSYLGSRQFRATSVFGITYSLEQLIGLIVKGVRRQAAEELGALPERVVVGRPVRFAGGEEDQDYALQRLREALEEGGFTDVEFEYEPVAAAYHYESGLDHDELVLIADFGGGTSDFCLARVGPGVRQRGRQRSDILGTEGVALAGDAFDARILRHRVAPALGKGTTYTTHGKSMPVPPWLYSHLEKWHHLSFLKTRDTIKLFDEIEREPSDPGKIAAFRHLVDSDLGYQLYRAVEKTKVALSSALDAPFSFHDEPLELEATVARRELDSWIGEELESIAECVDRLLATAGVAAEDVDRVFMTGGSSLVPAVRTVFETRFGAARLAGGDELVSVASGLARRAADGAAR
jgi:hypothetical chaperone protein